MDTLLKVPAAFSPGTSGSSTGSDMQEVPALPAGPSGASPTGAGYLGRLAEEKRLWEEEYKKHRRAAKRVQRRRAAAEVLPTVPREETLAGLSEEDRGFLEGRPDYEAFGRLVESVWKRRLCVLEEKERVDRGYERVRRCCEDLAERAAERVLRE